MITRTVTTAQGVTPQDLDPGDTTEGAYPTATVPNDYDSRGSLHSAFDFTNSCNGWQGVFQSTTKIPLVPIPNDGDPDLLPYIQSYFRPQAQLQLFFPTRTDGYQYWPHYWDDQRGQLTLDNRGIWVTDRVLYGSGSTPIKNALNDSEQYFEQDVMDREDPYKLCRKNFVILLTDGLETCSSTGSACVTATDLGKKGIPVFVVGYGLGTSGNDLQCISDNSGGQLYLPNNVEELVEALKNIGQEIEERARGFAAPVVPSVQASTAQYAYIAAFLPLNGRSIWQGHLRAFNVDPLTGLPPLTVDGLPDTSKALWDAGDQLIQLTSSQRKIYFGLPASGIPETRAQFVYPTSPGTDREVLRNLINSSLSDADLQTTIGFIRGDRDQMVYGGQKLGDIFHSVPQVQGPPQCYPCYLSNLHGYRDDTSTTTPDDGFRFHNRHRRFVVWVGADDGTIHGFDAGVWDDAKQAFDSGTGTELAAWVPKSVMPTFDDLALRPYQEWTVDGTPTVADVWIDPSHAGAPSVDDRQWRSVLITGERRGGSSYVCLDVTRPDAYDSNGVPQTTGRAPSCADGGTGCSGDWPAFMWEFTDTSDEDGNGAPDLGHTWSRPVVGFVKVAETSADTTTIEERSVAIFGGGLDPDGLAGKFLYIVDIETGKILFKTSAYGMVPGEVAAVDLNLDGFIERLYWADTAGFLWRMDVSNAGNLDPTTGRVTSWVAQPFFYAGYGQPFYMRPAVAIAGYAQDNHPYLAVAIGTGDRDNIFALNSYPHSFFTVIDRENYATVGTLTTANLQSLSSTGAPVEAAANYLTNPNLYGWDLVLGQWEKVNTSALIINQNVTFSTFTPSDQVIIVPDPTNPGSYLCKRQGDAKTYVVSFFNANPPAGSTSRFVQHDETVAMATDPMIYLGADGQLHVAQTLDTREFYQIIPPLSPPLRITSWKEE
jgi:type IV pilus assembly protein PilY1